MSIWPIEYVIKAVEESKKQLGGCEKKSFEYVASMLCLPVETVKEAVNFKELENGVSQ